MKTIYLLLFLLSCGVAKAQIVNIPDANFKNALLTTNCVDTVGNGNYNTDADINNDGEIQLSEAEAVIGLLVPSLSINSLEGIHFFINIKVLICNDNQLSNLDVSQNLNLERLSCQKNQLTELELVQNHNLTHLDCSQNTLTTLNLISQQNLEILNCRNNELTQLDASQKSNLRELYCHNNQITTLNISGNINQLWLHCYNNQITTLNLSQTTSLEWLFCFNNQLENLDVSESTNLLILDCFNNELTNLNIKNGNNIDLDRMFAYNNPNLNCIQVDDVNYAANQICDLTNGNGWCKDATASYNELCQLGTEDFTTTNFQLFPNPTGNILNIEIQENIKSVNIYSTQGILVKEVSSKAIDVSQLVAGVYFVRVDFDGKSFTKKFIKQ